MSEGREQLLADARRDLDPLLIDVDVARLDAGRAGQLLESVWSIIQSATPTLRDAGSIPLTSPGIVASLNAGSGGVPAFVERMNEQARAWDEALSDQATTLTCLFW